MGGQERVQPPIAAARPKDERDSSVGGAHGAGSSQQAPDSADTRPDKRARFDNLVTEFPVLPVGTPTAMTAMATSECWVSHGLGDMVVVLSWFGVLCVGVGGGGGGGP